MAIQPLEERLQVMVVGLGMVGIAFIEKMLTLDTAGKYFIRTCGEEPMVAYNRVGLTEYFQHRNVSDLYLNPVSWYAEQNPEHFAFHIGEQVLSIDPEKKEVHTSKDNVFKYDILVLATGSAAGLPPYVSADRARKTKGVFVYRSIADLESIINYAALPHVKRAEVIGGGVSPPHESADRQLLGLEAAKAVYDIQIPHVSIHIRQDYPLNRQLDASAGMLVLRKIEDLGVKVYTKSTIKDMTTTSDGESEVFTGFKTATDPIESDLVIYAVGIKPRDDLAGACGIELDSGGGVKVGDDLMSSQKDVYAIGECASWRGNYYGLIGPGIEQADILSFNLTQTHGIGAPKHAPRKMNTPDLSTRLKLMGVDVASFGDHFADQRVQPKIFSAPALGEVHIEKPSRSNENDTVKCLTYHDPFSATYKKYIFSQDGQHLLGGMMIGDVGDFAKLVGITKKKKKLDVPPSQFILGAKADGETNGDDLDDDTTICSCHNVAKGAIVKCVKDGITDFGKIKAATKVGAGCGGCVPLATSIFKAEMKKLGHAVNNNLCHHIKMSRQDLMVSIKIKKLKSLREVMETIGTGKDSTGCEICKPAIGSILSTLYNEHVMLPKHHGLQDTNDRFMANIQRDGTFSVVPRVQGGEIAPDKLIAIGQVAKEFNLYTKITGALRIDMFGARKQDLPAIWEKLIDAGLESGQAYGKTLRSVKSCVGSTWCRFGLGDSVGLAIDLENRYKGVRSPHKFKGGVSGCVRECAEAQGKDFGLIATDKGWNIFVGGNGGMTPRHAVLLATDVPPTKVIRIIDRYLMLYIRTADKLQRTARWVEGFDGGIEKLKKIILEDELGICAELEAEMQTAIGHYEDEWRRAVNDPELRKQFRQFVNTPEHRPAIEKIEERGQERPADWPQQFPTQKFEAANLPTPKDQWKWIPLATVDDLLPTDQNTTSAAVRYGDDSQLAIFHVPGRGYYATQQMCPHKRAFVLDHGIVGDDKDGNLYVSCPLHKRNYRFDTGECTNDADMKILAFDVKEQGGTLLVKLPPTDELDEMIGSSKWMVKKATAEALGRIPASKLEIVPPLSEADKDASAGSAGECATNGGGCGSAALDW